MKRKLFILLIAAAMLTGCNENEEKPIENIPISVSATASAGEQTNISQQKEPNITEEKYENIPAFADITVSEINETTEEKPPVLPKEPPDYNKFDEAIAEAKEKYEITGLTAALFKNGEIIYICSMGSADIENNLPCTENTRYRVASISKTISTIAMMTLYDKGVITPETVLSDATGIKYDHSYCKEKVKLWHLLTHTAGIIDTYDYDTTAVYTKNDINSLLRYALSGYEPGTVYSYSNFGAGSIGAVIERLTDKFFYDYADEVIFSPLGMDAGYVIDKISDKGSCAKLYDHDGEIFDVKNWGRTAHYYSSFGLGNSYYSAQCELIITAPDLARLGMILADSGETDGVRILSEDAVNLMNKRWFSTENFDMGLNVRIYDDLIEGRTIYGHPGNALGVITGLFYDPSDRTGIAFLTNHCLSNTDEKGFYKANKEVLTAAYEFILDRL